MTENDGCSVLCLSSCTFSINLIKTTIYMLKSKLDILKKSSSDNETNQDSYKESFKQELNVQK